MIPLQKKCFTNDFELIVKVEDRRLLLNQLLSKSMFKNFSVLHLKKKLIQPFFFIDNLKMFPLGNDSTILNLESKNL